MTEPRSIPFTSPVFIATYEKGYPYRDGWRTIAVAVTQYDADIIIGALQLRYKGEKFKAVYSREGAPQ